MADGETVEEALKEGEDAVLAWIRSAKEDGELIPEPRSMDKYSGQWRIRSMWVRVVKVLSTSQKFYKF